MPHILVSKKIASSGIERLRAQDGFSIEVLEDYTQQQFTDSLAGADGVILYFQPLQAADIAGAPGLKIVSRHGVGYDSVDVAALEERNIPLTITPGANAVAVAEHAISLLLAVARRSASFDRDVRTGIWSRNAIIPMFELFGKRALIVGAGRIGNATIQRLRAFDMQLQVYDPALPENAPFDEGVERIWDLPGALGHADIVSLHIPLTPATLNLIDPRQMKRGSILVNTARGGVVNEYGLLEALRSGHILGAALDVFEVEPLAADHPLCLLNNVVLSPHISALSDGGLRRMSLEAAQNVIDYFCGSLKPEVVVTKTGLTV
ncbi:D-isomer specific 2-hydroxyacid dehydrogenase NAD-binding protein (plasmid) [Advenella kashmirensis WT001]|uniref:D-isomer specific 2-hydroxyacid dehydrogenase NAD-binding protein n=1 Tax=Advenella kashmirensis (strain DSM 17095 / LMG 22695 / WT001) TaxID=1036672 RepID=I3UHX8_ADVKW|nr:hydroxyacid dehydrogenase [Advenella kashmirensis]AFK64616.1 D-isomer specific 2-hydroxyacid dehydrogenase NAD-binding protein [Advenella kashmirensis WT001]